MRASLRPNNPTHCEFYRRGDVSVFPLDEPGEQWEIKTGVSKPGIAVSCIQRRRNPSSPICTDFDCDFASSMYKQSFAPFHVVSFVRRAGILTFRVS